MTITRRDTIRLGGAAAASVMFTPFLSWASEVDDIIKGFSGDAEVSEGDIELTAPEIAENGNTVPVEVTAAGASAIMLIATANPQNNVCTANFGPHSGASQFSTRIRLAGTQEVVALAKMSDGSVIKTSKEIKVTIGGCGG